MMNERIKQLKEQASKLAAEQCNDTVDKFGIKLVFQDVFAEKFAELIVQECADTIKSNQWAKDNQAWSKGMNYSAELIKEHFGVEE